MRFVRARTSVKSSRVQAQATAGEHELKLSAVRVGAIGVAALCRHVEAVKRFGAEPDHDCVGHAVEALSFDSNVAGHLLTDAAAGQP